MISVMKALNLPSACIEYKLAEAILNARMGNKRTKFKITWIKSPMFFGHWLVQVMVQDGLYDFPLSDSGCDVILDGIKLHN